MDDKEFLNWVADRLVNVYNESENVDFVQRLRVIAEDTREGQYTSCTGEQFNKRCYLWCLCRSRTRRLLGSS